MRSHGLRGPLAGASTPQRLIAVCALQLAWWLLAHAVARAEDVPWSVRSSVGVAMMMSTDQLDSGWLAYDQPGFVGDVQLAYRLMPFLDAKLGAVGGAFLSADKPGGGLAAPEAGVLATVTHHSLHPYAQLDFGIAFTGTLVKPFLRVGGGLDIELTRAFMAGPVLGYGQVFQSDDPDIGSTDAQYLWVGLGVTYRPARSLPAAPKPVALVPEPPSSPAKPIEPSTHLMDLIERTLPSDPTRIELLAPVLFEFDSDALMPVGTAMLHEVGRELDKRPELELVEIQGYADQRGSAEYNRELSNRRAQRVFDWLVEHGVAQERLRVAAEGATAFVERGGSEQAHEQNRRVVFRVIRVHAP